MLALSVDRLREREAVLKAGAEFSFPVALLQTARTNEFGTPGTLPLTYVIDAQGKVLSVFKPGGEELTEKSLNKVLEAHLHAALAALTTGYSSL